jgi:hypothetical protein
LQEEKISSISFLVSRPQGTHPRVPKKIVALVLPRWYRNWIEKWREAIGSSKIMATFESVGSKMTFANSISFGVLIL